MNNPLVILKGVYTTPSHPTLDRIDLVCSSLNLHGELLTMIIPGEPSAVPTKPPFEFDSSEYLTIVPLFYVRCRAGSNCTVISDVELA